MNKKIFGVTVGTPLPKPDLRQTDPTKGDFVKGKDVIPTKVSQLENDSGYLEENKLQSAISNALEQAKESGGFNGEPGYTPVKGVDYFTDADKAEIVDAVKNETKQKYGKMVVFGDSLAEGENNNSYSFVDVLRESGLFTSVVKASRSGATIGPYQTDAHADGYDLISQIERYAADVVNAEIILCEYQYNDVKAVVYDNISMGFKHNTADTETVCGYMRRALNRIRELNPTVHIVWMPSVKSDWNFASLTTDVKDYLMLFEATALSVAKEYGVGIISVMENLFNPALLSSDNIHPNSEGHERIAQIILHNLYADTDLMLPERLLIMYGDLEQPSSMVIDGSAPIIATLMEAGIRVRLAWNGGSGAILFDAVLANYQGIIFRSDGGSFGNFTVVWGLNGKINFQQGSGTGGSGEVPENVVVCDLNGATEDESAVPVNADTLGGFAASEYVKKENLLVEDFTDKVTLLPIVKDMYMSCIRLSNLVCITVAFNLNSSPSAYETTNIATGLPPSTGINCGALVSDISQYSSVIEVDDTGTLLVRNGSHSMGSYFWRGQLIYACESEVTT